LALCSQL